MQVRGILVKKNVANYEPTTNFGHQHAGRFRVRRSSSGKAPVGMDNSFCTNRSGISWRWRHLRRERLCLAALYGFAVHSIRAAAGPRLPKLR